MNPNGEQAGKVFLAANKAKRGVTTLPSGLQFRVLEEGGGLAHPTVSTPCECHYAGRLLDGTEFDSSYKRGTPSTFAPNQVISGWTEAMQLMVQGDKWEMYIPFGLAYGARGKPPKIPPAAALIFVMEIVAIKGKTTPKVASAAPKQASSRAGTSSDAREEGGKGGKAAEARDDEGRSAEAPKRKHESEARQRESSDSSDSDSSSDSEERRRKKHKKEKKEKKEKKRKDKHKSSKGKKEKHKKDKGKKHKKEEVVERSIISGKPLLKKLDKTDEDHARDAKRQQLLAFLNDAY